MSTDNKFNVTISLDREAVAGLLVTALSDRNTITRSWSTLVGTYAVDMTNCVGILLDGNVSIIDKMNGGAYRINRAAVERGLAVMARVSPRQFGKFLAGNGDNVTASVFLECVLFGEA